MRTSIHIAKGDTLQIAQDAVTVDSIAGFPPYTTPVTTLQINGSQSIEIVIFGLKDTLTLVKSNG